MALQLLAHHVFALGPHSSLAPSIAPEVARQEAREASLVLARVIPVAPCHSSKPVRRATVEMPTPFAGLEYRSVVARRTAVIRVMRSFEEGIPGVDSLGAGNLVEQNPEEGSPEEVEERLTARSFEAGNPVEDNLVVVRFVAETVVAGSTSQYFPVGQE